MADLYAYARELAEYRRANPGNDIMSLLLEQVDAEGGRVSVEEFQHLFWLFCIAGNETVRNALPGCLYGPARRAGRAPRICSRTAACCRRRSRNCSAGGAR